MDATYHSCVSPRRVTLPRVLVVHYVVWARFLRAPSVAVFELGSAIFDPLLLFLRMNQGLSCVVCLCFLFLLSLCLSLISLSSPRLFPSPPPRTPTSHPLRHD